MDYNEAMVTLVRPHLKDGKGNECNLKWRDIKKFADTLSDDQLDLDVIAAGEYYLGIFGIQMTQDDLINPSGEGLETKSSYLVDGSNSEEDFDEEIIYPKGTIFLMMDDSLFVEVGMVHS